MNNPIRPTVGRKVYFHSTDEQYNKIASAPMDATILVAHDDEHVNLHVIDHLGHTYFIEKCPWGDSSCRSGGDDYWDWMPFQKGQAKPSAAEQAKLELQQGLQQNTQENQVRMHTYCMKPIWSMEQEVKPAWSMEVGGLTFGAALEALKNGLMVKRAGWNGKGMFLFLVNGSRFEVNRAPLSVIFPTGTKIEYNAHVDIKNVDGSISTWSPSIGDTLAEDWIVFEPNQ